MAKTGINIQVSNTVMGSPAQVNANTMLVVMGAKAETTGSMPFKLNTAYMLRSAEEATETLGLTETNNAALLKEINDFYAPKSGVNNSGTVLWIYGCAEQFTQDIKMVTATVANGFEYRPRTILFSIDPAKTAQAQSADPTTLQAYNDKLYANGFATVMVTCSDVLDRDDLASATDMSKLIAPMVGVVAVTNKQASRACVGAVGGYLASLAVGTSIGDVSLGPFATQMYLLDGTISSGRVSWKNTPCSTLMKTEYDQLGEFAYIFARTRPPQNGVYFNDGATAVDQSTALSSLENVRTIASMVDDLRAFLNPYLNTKVPVDNAGNINSTYKNVVESNAQSVVIQPYIYNGDISNARITIEALNGDFLGTRTWKVTLEILDAATLRWVEGYVFYVKNLD